MQSRCTIGAMASKKASASLPVSPAIAAASAGEVSGPVATMTLSQSAGGRPAISSRRMLDQRMGFQRCRRRWRQSLRGRRRARRRPVPDVASAARITSEPSRRISSCRRPTALCSLSSERNELEQTSSASASVLCAAVVRTGRISCSTTGTPARGNLPGGLAAGEPAADDVYCRLQFHAHKLCFSLGGGNDSVPRGLP